MSMSLGRIVAQPVRYRNGIPTHYRCACGSWHPYHDPQKVYDPRRRAYRGAGCARIAAALRAETPQEAA